MGAGLALTFGCGDRDDEPLTTLDGAIVLGKGGALASGPGEPYQVGTGLSAAQAGREGRRRSLVVFHHLTDFRVVDEESPLRSEWVDSCPTPLSTSAFRPQETLGLQAAAATVAQANRISRSPVTGRRVDFAVHTGNAADNAQYNELRWFLDIMDGKLVNPDSGSPGYEGVQERSPLDAYPDLLAQAQLPFRAQALRYPWYVVVGNSDLLAEGNFPPSEAANAIAVGDQKIIDIGRDKKEEVCADPSKLLGPDASGELLRDPGTIVRQVSRDRSRRLLSRKEWIAEHFNTSERPGPIGHGFQSENLEKDIGYYVLEHGPIVFIALDTVNPGGFATGSIDAAQFAWLEEQLKAHSSRYFDREGGTATTVNEDRLIVILSHHTAETMNNPVPGPDAKEERFRGPQLEELLHRYPNVILHVAGHSLEHRVLARPDPARRSQGYWQIRTASPRDFPMQSRQLEIADNRDGTLSIFATVYDMAAPVNAGDAQDPTPDDGVNEQLLASLARQVAAGDPQLQPGMAGLGPSDRNVELLLPAPFDLAKLETPGPSRPGPAGRQ
ncbi:MAG: hypothetical protein HYY03_01540, partial [Chloroflexi bacterium]|nr:hypothetical protein [Chloroflexota bacterium]